MGRVFSGQLEFCHLFQWGVRVVGTQQQIPVWWGDSSTWASPGPAESPSSCKVFQRAGLACSRKQESPKSCKNPAKILQKPYKLLLWTAKSSVTALKLRGEREQGAEGRISLDGSNYLSSVCLPPRNKWDKPWVLCTLWEAKGGSILMGTGSWYSINVVFFSPVLLELMVYELCHWVHSCKQAGAESIPPNYFREKLRLGTHLVNQLGQEKLWRVEDHCQISKCSSHFMHLNFLSASPWLWSSYFLFFLKSLFHRIDENPVTFFTPRCCWVLPLWTSCWSSNSVSCPASPA